MILQLGRCLYVIEMELYQMVQLPDTGFLKLAQIIGDRKANPPIPAIIPVSPATWFAGVQSGRYPAPVRIGGGRGAFYRVEDIKTLIASVQAKS